MSASKKLVVLGLSKFVFCTSVYCSPISAGLVCRMSLGVAVFIYWVASLFLRLGTSLRPGEIRSIVCRLVKFERSPADCGSISFLCLMVAEWHSCFAGAMPNGLLDTLANC